jgi:uncharacterized protein YbbK (DUF523 family)
MAEPRRIKVGISSCLLGAYVRYDGGHKRDKPITDRLSPVFEWVPVCPEVDSGLGVPRQPVRLVRQDQGAVKVLGAMDPRLDVTASLTEFSHSRMPDLATIRGYIVKSKSPSCGMTQVPIHSPDGRSESSGPGVFTSILMQTYPLLPVEDEESLAGPARRENFLERVRVYDRWRTLLESGLTIMGLSEFHSRHEILIRSRNPAACDRLQSIVRRLVPENLKASADSYGAGLMNALKRYPISLRDFRNRED